MPIYALNGIKPRFPEKDLYWVAPNATLIGNIELHDNSSIWFGAVLRGDNELISVGPNTNIQDNCTLHTDPGFPLSLGEGVTVGHNAILHGCTIADNSLIGMGSTILNGAKIGKNVLIGANALVPEGKTIPDNSLVMGSPAKIIRQIDEKGEAMLKKGAQTYVDRWKQYAQQLQEI